MSPEGPGPELDEAGSAAMEAFEELLGTLARNMGGAGCELPDAPSNQSMNPDGRGQELVGAGTAAVKSFESLPGTFACEESGAGHDLPDAPGTYEGWIFLLSRAANLKQFGIALAWGFFRGFFLFQERAGPVRPPGKSRRSGELFPLPVQWPEDFALVWRQRYVDSCIVFSVRCWVASICAALNSLYGCGCPKTGRSPGKVHVAALNGLQEKVERFLAGDGPVPFRFEDVVEELKCRKVNYVGEEVAPPCQLTCGQILKSLPPLGHGGAIPVTSYLKGRTKYLMENPLESLIPVRERTLGSMQARVHVAKGEELGIFKLLEERGVTSWIPSSEVFCDERGACLNGLFGVIKPGKFTPTGEPILRVIMNLVPCNRLFEVICGDKQLLPHGSAWIPLVVTPEEELRVSQGDMSAAFYLFSIPTVWRSFMSFNFEVDGEKIGRAAGQRYRPCCVVLPMGWSSSVGVMQMLSRELLLSQGIPGNLELHKGRPAPVWFSRVIEQASSTRAWWQVYLDNFMSAERCDFGYQAIDVDLQSSAMRAWHGAGVLTADDKQVLGAEQATELGIRIDGKNGLLGASPERIFKTCLATLRILKTHAISPKETQVVLGRWIFVLQFRRPAMAVLARAWAALETPWPSVRTKNELLKELQMLLCLAPVLQVDLRSDYDEQVTCSDASESGGAAAAASSLSWSGRTLVNTLRDTRLAPLEIPVLVVSAFNGVGGSFRIYDILGVNVAARVSIEINKEANRVTRCAWPGVEELRDIESITLEEVKRWSNLWPRIREVHLWGGFPCIHLSSVRAFRENLFGEGSRLFWKLLELLQWLKQVFEPTARVKFCIENVASMDEEARREISSQLDVQPVKLDPADTLPYNRPRLAWCSEELYEMEELSLWTEKDYIRAYVQAGSVETSQWIRPGWSWPAGDDGSTKFPTFMKSIPRRAPPPFPAGLQKSSAGARARWEEAQYRFPPYQYGEKYLVTHPQKGRRLIDSSEREILLGLGAGHTAACRPASLAKASWTQYEDSRLSLCGDSFSIPSFAIMGAVLISEWVPRMKPSVIIQRLGLAPGASAHPSVMVPMTRWLAYGDDGEERVPADQLVRCLGLQPCMTKGFLPRVVLAGRTQEDRRRRRAGIRLRDFTISAQTRRRYEAAVGRVLPFLEAQPNLDDLDSILVEWIELQWVKGEALTYIADCLSGLHFFWPELKGLLRQAWRMFKSWRRIETPSRAPPLTIALAKAFVAKGVADNNLPLAALVAIGFHGMLRTGELLNLRYGDIEVSSTCGVVNLHHSKSGHRTGAQEAVALRDSLTLLLLEILFSVQHRYKGDPLWPHSAQAFRHQFQKLCDFFQISSLLMKPYSLRRGGATFLLQSNVPLETILVRGRWRSLGVARLYLEDGLAQLPSLRLSASVQSHISRWAEETPATAFQP
eukprot:s2158_g4.t1